MRETHRKFTIKADRKSTVKKITRWDKKSTLITKGERPYFWQGKHRICFYYYSNNSLDFGFKAIGNGSIANAISKTLGSICQLKLVTLRLASLEFITKI